MKKLLVTLTVTAAFASISAHAQTLANFQVLGAKYTGYVNPQYTGAGVLTGNNNWNTINAASNGPAKNGATTATDSATGDILTIGYSGQYATNSNNALLDGYALVDHGLPAGTIDFSGLAAGTYTLVLYAQNGYYNGGNATDFTFNGSSAVATEGPLPATPGTFTAGVNYVEFTGLTVGSNGTLNGTFDALSGATGNAEADFDGAQIELTAAATPEPSTLALMAAGFGAMVMFVRRRLLA